MSPAYALGFAENRNLRRESEPVSLRRVFFRTSSSTLQVLV